MTRLMLLSISLWREKKHRNGTLKSCENHKDVSTNLLPCVHGKEAAVSTLLTERTFSQAVKLLLHGKAKSILTGYAVSL